MELGKQVERTRALRKIRLNLNYSLARCYSYTAIEAAILMNRSYKRIILQAAMDDRTPKLSEYINAFPEHYIDLITKAYDTYNIPKDVTEIGAKK